MREIEDQLSKGLFIPEAKIPTFKLVAEDWLNHKKSNLRASTWSVYEGHTKNHFGEFDDLKINRITTAKIEKFITDRQSAGMNILTLRKILVTLGQIMRYAVRHRYISNNSFTDAERPRGGQSETDKQPIRILTPGGINSLLDATEDFKYRTLFRMAIMSGARQGELLGLKWSDVDWDNSQIHIQRTYNNQAWYKTKTKNSNRKIDLGPSMMAELKKWKLACQPNRLNLIFPNKEGGPINHNNLISRYFEPALVKAKSLILCI